MGEQFFNASMFTTDVEESFETHDFTNKSNGEKLSISVRCVHDENQFIDEFVSRVIWPSAISLAQYFCTSPTIVEDKRVLELGSGTGLTGFLLAKLGAAKVTLTDYSADSLQVIDAGITKNNLSSQASSMNLKWGDSDDHDKIIESHGKFDLCVAADVVYEPDCVAPLFNTAFALMKHKHSKFYLANHKSRFNKFEDVIKKISKEMNLFSQKITLDPSISESKNIIFYIFTKN